MFLCNPLKGETPFLGTKMAIFFYSVQQNEIFSSGMRGFGTTDLHAVRHTKMQKRRVPGGAHVRECK